jgi:hypothetical protein
MLCAIRGDEQTYSDEYALDEFSKALHVEIPKSISELFEKQVIHKQVVDRQDIEKEILNFIKA